eukprot:1021066-Amphidinium_carterae.1
MGRTARHWMLKEPLEKMPCHQRHPAVAPACDARENGASINTNAMLEVVSTQTLDINPGRNTQCFPRVSHCRLKLHVVVFFGMGPTVLVSFCKAFLASCLYTSFFAMASLLWFLHQHSNNSAAGGRHGLRDVFG